LRKNGELLYFGDSIVISTPKYDAAGHISEHEEKTYKFGVIPHFEEFVTAITDITELQEIVGINNYPADAGPISSRVLSLELIFEELQDKMEVTIKDFQDKMDIALEQSDRAESAAASAASNAEYAARAAEMSSDSAA
jgi:hypothetical protein